VGTSGFLCLSDQEKEEEERGEGEREEEEGRVSKFSSLTHCSNTIVP
jgi:hypothetical protein